MTVKEAQSKIDAKEFAEWVAYDRMSPIGEIRIDLAAATVASTVAAVMGGKNNKAKFSDFMLNYIQEEDTTEAIPPDQIMNMLMTSGIKIKDERKDG